MELPGVARRCQEPPEAGRSHQELRVAAKSSQEYLEPSKAARSRQKLTEATRTVRSCQKQPGSVGCTNLWFRTISTSTVSLQPFTSHNNKDAHMGFPASNNLWPPGSGRVGLIPIEKP